MLYLHLTWLTNGDKNEMIMVMVMAMVIMVMEMMVMKMAMDIMVMDHCNVMLVLLGNEVHCRDHMVSGEMEMSQKHKQRCK